MTLAELSKKIDDVKAIKILIRDLQEYRVYNKAPLKQEDYRMIGSSEDYLNMLLEKLNLEEVK